MRSVKNVRRARARMLSAAAATTAVAATAAIMTAVALAAPAQALETHRWWGNDRHATSAAASAASFTGHVDTVVVVNGTSFADALAAAPLAAASRAPLLTVTTDGVPATTAAELARLTPKTVLVIGGPTVIPDAVVDQLKGYASDGVIRIFGANRYDTARVISDDHFAGHAREVFVASGENFPDALAAGAAGAALGAPLVLTGAGALSTEARAAITKLAPQRITIVGGTMVISPAVEAELTAAYPGAVRRIAGTDRYDTAAKMLLATRVTASSALLASGTNFPDALAAAATGQALLLSRPDCLPQVTADAYAAAGVTAVTGLGGTGVLSQAALAGQVCAALPAPTATPTASSTATPKPSAAPSSSAAPVRPGKKNCSDFPTWRAAQDWFTTYYPAYGDVAGLDRDNNGIACESLPGAPR